MSSIISPDCRDKNHQKCPGDAWDEPHDHVTECQCRCHGKQLADPRVEAAAQALLDVSKRDLPEGMYEKFDDVSWEVFEEDAVAMLAAADAVDPLRKPGHRAEISGDTWTLQHPPECRAEMLACPLNEAMRSLDPTCLADGVWAVELDADKELNFTPVVTP